jgi:hypothetical protein
MKYRIGEVQDVKDGRDFHFGFNILDAHGAPIVRRCNGRWAPAVFAVPSSGNPRCCCIDRHALAPPPLRTIGQQVEVCAWVCPL